MPECQMLCMKNCRGNSKLGMMLSFFRGDSLFLLRLSEQRKINRIQSWIEPVHTWASASVWAGVFLLLLYF